MTNILPNGWEAASIEDLCDINPKHSKETDLDTPVSFVPMPAVCGISGRIKDHEAKLLGNVWKGYTHFAEDDVIFAKITPCMENGKSAVALGLTNGMACGSTEFYVMRSHGGVLPKYLHQFVRQQGFRDEAGRNMSGAVGQRRVPKAYLQNQILPVPPLNEQHRIVKKIDTLMERSSVAKEALDAIPDLLDQYRQSVLASAFRGDLTKDWREQNPDVEPASKLLERIRTERRQRWEEAELAKMRDKGKEPTNNKWKAKYKDVTIFEPDDSLAFPLHTWLHVPMETISNVIDPNPSHRMPKYTDEGVPFLSTENFEKGEGWNFTKGKKVTNQTLEEQQKRYKVESGDFVLSRIGTIGKTRYLPTVQNYCLSHALCVIQPRSNYIIPEYLRLVAASDAIIEQAHSGVQSVGVPDLGMAKIRDFTIPIPPIGEQLEIIKKCENLITQIDNIKRLHQQSFDKLGKLNQSILAKAFRGELVPQDETDEPASVLLERIHQERAKAEAAKPKRGRKKKAV